MARGKVVLVTGCSSGIGEATALRLSRRGWRVFASARDPSALGKLAKAGCQTLALDVTKDASMKAAVDRVLQQGGRIDALVNNAGYSLSGALETLDMEDVRRQFETNVFGVIRLSQLVLPAMRAQKAGRIVTVGSVGGKLTFPGGSAYHGTKFALEGINDVLRYEVKNFGVDVVLIEPGLIRTNFAKAVATLMGKSANDTGPYAEFNQAVARATEEVFVKGPLASMAGTADAVARAIERGLTARSPKTRYTVSASATLLLTMRAWMSDRGWDRFLASNFPQPGKA
jgi:NAD(P)-dependent dehydrogenase (short-subunit alcohol dehydrogenase family)